MKIELIIVAIGIVIAVARLVIEVGAAVASRLC